MVLDENDFDQLSRHKWRAVGGPEVYYAGRSDMSGSTIRMHREILAAPGGVEVDHIDGNPLNNCRSNLRLCTRSENMRNRRKFDRGVGISRFIGVGNTGSKTAPRPWFAHIKIHGKITHLGSFESEIGAAEAYDRAAIIQHGRFASLNFAIKELFAEYLRCHPLAKRAVR